MNLPLSKRLLACCEFITPGDRVADIGCDHGYLGIHILLNNIATSVIAADINEMPLQSAMRNAQKYGVDSKMTFFLSDGVQKIPQDFDTLVCAGMGADTMISILEAAPWLKSNTYCLVLQCQSRTHQLRKYLSDQGWWISEETVLRDGRFLYTVIKAVWGPERPRLTLGQCYFPPALLQHLTPELPEYFQQLLFRLRRAVAGQGETADPIMIAALQELENDASLNWLKEIGNGNC